MAIAGTLMRTTLIRRAPVWKIHPDTWKWGEGEHFVWKEHPGRGY